MTTHQEPAHKMTVKVCDQLRTIQGYTIEEYVTRRDELIAELQGDVELVQLAKAAGNAAPLVTVTEASATVQPVAPTGGGAPVWGEPTPPAPFTPPSAPPAFAAAAVPQCNHGARTARAGQGAKGPWKAWFCGSPKGTPNQCDAIWVQRGTPEWSNFPA